MHIFTKQWEIKLINVKIISDKRQISINSSEYFFFDSILMETRNVQGLMIKSSQFESVLFHSNSSQILSQACSLLQKRRRLSSYNKTEPGKTWTTFVWRRSPEYGFDANGIFQNLVICSSFEQALSSLWPNITVIKLLISVRLDLSGERFITSLSRFLIALIRKR